MAILGLLATQLAVADPLSLAPESLDALADQVRDRTGLFEPVFADERARGVVNGTVLSDGNEEVVALAGLDTASGESFVFCSGSLISDRWVLTAAHCIEGSRDVQGYGLQLHILWGGDLLGNGYVDAIPWAQGIADPTYNSANFTNDAGLVELAEPKTDGAWMVLNDAPMADSWAGEPLTFYGFGVTRDQLDDAGIKRTTTIPIERVDAFNIYTFSAQTNVCSGDSGGPSTYEGPDGPEQVGINAFVTPGCVGGSAGSTRVDNHIDWIRSYVPDVALDYDDLPQIELPGGPPVGEGRTWNDLGVEDANGFGGDWESSGTASGCAHAPAGAPGLGLALVGLLGLGRRRR